MPLTIRSKTIVNNLVIGSTVSSGGGTTPSYLVVGAFREEGVVNDAGAAFVYDPSDYTQTPTYLSASDGAAYDSFGHAVAASSTHIVVGAHYDDDDGSSTGAVYVWDATNLSNGYTKLVDASSGDQFGYSVDANDDYIIVGAKNDNEGASNAGSVLVYDATDLTADPTRLVNPTPQSSDQFGNSVALTDTQLIVGAYSANDFGADAGIIYIYDITDLSASPSRLYNSVAYSEFGWSVAASSNYIVVGAHDQNSNTGSVYVYDATDLSASPTQLTPSTLESNYNFGHSVAVDNNYLVVGCQNNNAPVYVYDVTNLSATPTELTGSTDAQFGYSVSIFGNSLAVGSRNGGGNDGGSVSIYNLSNLSSEPTEIQPTSVGAYDYFGVDVDFG